VIDLSQYVFEVLRKDDEFILYRGRSKDDGSSRVLVVSPVTEYPAPEILKWQEHAYCLREELDPTWEPAQWQLLGTGTARYLCWRIPFLYRDGLALVQGTAD
jgi:hypothetical protein